MFQVQALPVWCIHSYWHVHLAGRRKCILKQAILGKLIMFGSFSGWLDPSHVSNHIGMHLPAGSTEWMIMPSTV